MKLSSLRVYLKIENFLSVQKEFRIWVFFGWNIKKIISICKVPCKNKKYLHLGQKLLYLGIFGLEFEKAIVIFEINAVKFV